MIPIMSDIVEKALIPCGIIRVKVEHKSRGGCHIQDISFLKHEKKKILGKEIGSKTISDSRGTKNTIIEPTWNLSVNSH